MENNSKSEPKTETDKLQDDLQPDIYGSKINKEDDYKNSVNELNSKILKVTMIIRDQYPELSKYIEEMPVTIPDEKRPEITLKVLRSYYDSLNTLLSKYILEQPENLNKSD